MKPLRSLIIPVAVLMIGTGAALATSTSENAEAMLEKGYRYDASAPVKCIYTNVDCGSTFGELCTWMDANNIQHPLYRKKSPTDCGLQLYKP